MSDAAAQTIESLAPPWRDGRAPLYARIRDAIAARGTAPEELRLSPEEPDETRWAAGASDKILGAPDESRAKIPARAMAAALNCAVRLPDEESAAYLYALLRESDAIAVIDDVLPKIAEESALHEPAIAALARRLACEAPDAEPVKIAIALLGVFGEPRDEELIATLGAYDEFTVFAAVALSNLSDDIDVRVWRLAQSVYGWGRLQAVERLKHTSDPLIKDWLVREGFRNAAAPELLACLCARAGGLREALSAERIDDGLLAAARDILDALINGGPAEDIADYEDAQAVIALYLAHLAKKPARDLRHVLLVRKLMDVLSNDPRLAAWPAQRKWALRTKAASELARPEWRALAQNGLQSGAAETLQIARDAATVLGMT